MKFNVKSLFFGLSFVSMIGLVACGSDTESVDDGEQTTTAASEAAPVSDAAQQALNDAQRQAEVDAAPKTSIAFAEGQTYDFGKVQNGEKVKYSYKFTNTGNEPLIISNCKASCGCTVPKCPTEPIAPGESGEIPVEFDSRNKPGPQSKSVTITANTNPDKIILTIKGEVEGSQPVAQ